MVDVISNYPNFNKHFLIFPVQYSLFAKINQFRRPFCWTLMKHGSNLLKRLLLWKRILTCQSTDKILFGGQQRQKSKMLSEENRKSSEKMCCYSSPLKVIHCTINEEILNGKLHFLFSDLFIIPLSHLHCKPLCEISP